MKNLRTFFIFIFFFGLSSLTLPAQEPAQRDSLSGILKTAGFKPSALHVTPLQNNTVEAGGIMPGLKALIFGPRIGIESNEGKPVTFVEKANVFVPLVPFQTYSQTGINGFLASAFLGPRVGTQLKQRKIRLKEWVGLLPVAGVGFHLMTSENPSAATVIIEVAAAAVLSRLWPAIEAFRGKTMTEIERIENLRK